MSVLRSHNNKTRGGLGRVCATGMYRSIEHVKFPKFQTGIFCWMESARHFAGKPLAVLRNVGCFLRPYTFSSRLLYNVLLYLRCSAEKAKINLMVFLFMLYCVVEPKYGIFRRLSGYELAGNEIFLRNGSSGDWGSWSAVWVECSAIKGMLITWESILGGHLV